MKILLLLSQTFHSGRKNSRATAIFKKETFFILQKNASTFLCHLQLQMPTVVHLNFHGIHDYVTELRHKIYINNLNIGVHWKQIIATVVET